MKMLIYFSEATRTMQASDLEALLTQARSFNSANGISGLLLYQSRCFLQALEGAAEAIDPLYERIQADSRHTNLRLLYDQPADRRCFEAWGMGFHLPDDEHYQSLPGYLDIFGSGIVNEIDLAEEMTFTMVQLFKQYVRDTIHSN